MLARGDPPGGRGDAGDARLPLGVATFYDMLRTEPTGRALRLRLHQRGLPPAEREGASTTRSPTRRATQGLEDVEVREFECLGACDIAPMASIDGRFVGPLATATHPR